MAKLEYSESFAEDVASVKSAKLMRRIWDIMDSIELFEGLGSPDVPASISEEFDGEVRKVVVNPFDLFYTVHRDKDIVRLEALVHQKQAR